MDEEERGEETNWVRGSLTLLSDPPSPLPWDEKTSCVLFQGLFVGPSKIREALEFQPSLGNLVTQ